MSFFAAIKALFPRSKAFDLTQDSKLRRFIKGLAVLPEDVKESTERVYMDLFPGTTRALEEWEDQFKVFFASEQYGENQRGILEALWQANAGGQSAPYLESVLQKISPKIKVYENVPVKNPRDTNSVYSCMCGQRSAVCGNKNLTCGFKVGDSEFVPTVIKNNGGALYDIPVDSRYWENYFFICKNCVRNSRHEIVYCEKLRLDSRWRGYVEYLILKIKPAQMGALVFIEWVDGLDD